jgi:hypothetical protein
MLTLRYNLAITIFKTSNVDYIYLLVLSRRFHSSSARQTLAFPSNAQRLKQRTAAAFYGADRVDGVDGNSTFALPVATPAKMHKSGLYCSRAPLKTLLLYAVRLRNPVCILSKASLGFALVDGGTRVVSDRGRINE